MQINGNSSVSGSNGITQADAPSYQQRASRSGSVEDSASLSADSVQAQQLKESLSRLPEARADRVAAARASLKDGNQPSYEQLAGAIVNEYSQ